MPEEEEFFEWEELEKSIGGLTEEQRKKVMEEAEKYMEYRKAVESVKVPDNLGQWTPETFKKIAISTLQEALLDWDSQYEQQLFGKVLPIYEKNTAVTALFQGVIQYLASILIFLVEIHAPGTEGLDIQTFINSYYDEVANIIIQLKKKIGAEYKEPFFYHGFIKKVNNIALDKAQKQKF
jgi:hypothetical protein